MDADGSERYCRCAKSIVQVGPLGAGSQGQVTNPIGLPLEILPEANPYAMPRSTRVLSKPPKLATLRVALSELTGELPT
jgi:hypothetical protein